MPHGPEHPVNPGDRVPEPLPGKFEPSLRMVDAKIARAIHREPTPPHLVDRVYHASAPHLPGKAVPASLPFRRTTVPAARSTWGRLAMAASVGLAFMVAAWFLAMPHGHTPGDDGMAHRPSPTSDVIEDERLYSPHISPARLSREAESVILESIGVGYGYHPQVREATFAEFDRDIRDLVYELEDRDL